MINKIEGRNINAEYTTKRKPIVSIKCGVCNSSNIYVLTDGTIVCRKCGHRHIVNKGKE